MYCSYFLDAGAGLALVLFLIVAGFFDFVSWAPFFFAASTIPVVQLLLNSSAPCYT